MLESNQIAIEKLRDFLMQLYMTIEEICHLNVESVSLTTVKQSKQGPWRKRRNVKEKPV